MRHSECQPQKIAAFDIERPDHAVLRLSGQDSACSPPPRKSLFATGTPTSQQTRQARNKNSRSWCGRVVKELKPSSAVSGGPFSSPSAPVWPATHRVLAERDLQKSNACLTSWTKRAHAWPTHRTTRHTRVMSAHSHHCARLSFSPTPSRFSFPLSSPTLSLSLPLSPSLSPSLSLSLLSLPLSLSLSLSPSLSVSLSLSPSLSFSPSLSPSPSPPSLSLPIPSPLSSPLSLSLSLPVSPCLSLSLPVYPCLSLSIPVAPCLSLSLILSSPLPLSPTSDTHAQCTAQARVARETAHVCAVSAQTCGPRDVQHVFASPWSSRRLPFRFPARHCFDVLSFFSRSYVLVTVKAFPGGLWYGPGATS